MTSKTWASGTVLDSVWLQEVDDASFGIVYMWQYFSAAQKADILARTYTLDVTTEVQEAIDDAAGKILVWPSGGLLISTCLNSTDRGSTATVWLGQGFDVDVSSGTTLKCQTAADATLSPGWCADFTGSQNITLNEMNFWGTGTNASTKGLLFARAGADIQAFAQQVQLNKISTRFDVDDNNYISNSVGIANVQAEHFQTRHCFFKADYPEIHTLYNDLTWVSPHSLINRTAHITTTNIQHHGTAFYSYSKSGTTLYGVAGARWNGCVWASPHVTTLPAIICNSSAGHAYVVCQDLHFDGQVENYPYALALNTASADHYNITSRLFMVAATAAQPYVQTASGVILRNCIFNNQRTQNIVTSCVALQTGTNNTLISSYAVLYPNDTVSFGAGTTATGRLHDYAGNGTSLTTVANGVNAASVASPYTTQTRIDPYGNVTLSGTMLADGTGVGANATICTITAAHRPNRVINSKGFLSGTGSVDIYIGTDGTVKSYTAMGAATQLSFDSVSFVQTN